MARHPAVHDLFGIDRVIFSDLVSLVQGAITMEGYYTCHCRVPVTTHRCILLRIDLPLDTRGFVRTSGERQRENPSNCVSLWSRPCTEGLFLYRQFAGGHQRAFDCSPFSRSRSCCNSRSVSYTHLRAHETGRNLVCRLL